MITCWRSCGRGLVAKPSTAVLTKPGRCSAALTCWSVTSRTSHCRVLSFSHAILSAEMCDHEAGKMDGGVSERVVSTSASFGVLVNAQNRFDASGAITGLMLCSKNSDSTGRGRRFESSLGSDVEYAIVGS